MSYPQFINFSFHIFGEPSDLLPFVLTAIKKNDQIWEAPNGDKENRLVMTNTTRPGRERIFSRTSLTDGRSKQQQQQARNIVSRTTHTKANNILETGGSSMKVFKAAGWKPKEGFQLRYIYFLHPKERKNLTVPILPFSEIDKMGAGMYKGIKRPAGVKETRSTYQSEDGGAIPTAGLSSNESEDFTGKKAKLIKPQRAQRAQRKENYV